MILMKDKKGFTLIELLAVILVLGIIALIAISTINKKVEDARKEAFRATAYGIIESGELYYTEDLIKEGFTSENVIFEFPDDFNNLDIKGENPKGGSLVINPDGDTSIAINNGKYCAIKDFNEDKVSITEDLENCVNLESKPYYVLQTYQQSKKEFHNSSYNNKIVSITFKYGTKVPDDAVVTWDLSAANDDSILGYLVHNQETSSYYDMYVISDGKIKANPNSSYWFNNMKNLLKINFENFDTSEVTNMANMFQYTY